MKSPVTLKTVKLARNLLLLLIFVALAFGLIVFVNYITIPTQDTARTHFDVVIVLGTPARADGTPSPEQRERVLEGVREYRAGVAGHLIMTGGAAHNQFIEAHVMAQFARAQGVPSDAILEEGQAQNTIQNIYYSARIMHAHGWNSAEVVSSPYHLGRTALILNVFDRRQRPFAIDWRTHAAHWPAEYRLLHETALYYTEAYRCLWIRVLGFPNSRFLPAAAQFPKIGQAS